MVAYWLGGTPPRKTSVSVPRLTPDRKVRTTTSPCPGSGSVDRLISPDPGARSQNACAPSCKAPPAGTAVFIERTYERGGGPDSLVAARRAERRRTPHR